MSEFEFRLPPFCHFYSYVKIKSGKMKKFEIHIEFFINIKKKYDTPSHIARSK